MKIFINPTNENWICDRMRQEFQGSFPDLCSDNLQGCDVSWIIAPWTMPNLSLLKGKKNIFSIYHIVPEKFNKSRLQEMDEYASAFHTICKKTQEFIKNYVTKPIFVEPFWINQNIFFYIDKLKCRKELRLPVDKFIIGSFQRDTEGHDLINPKLEKGPDRFCEMAEEMSNSKNLYVLLGGWRRQYVINRLKKANIDYSYVELADFKTLNKMYNCLDLYISPSRHEGGPQSIPECAITRTPIISTNVGCAEVYLSPKSIFEYPDYGNCIPDVDYAYNKAVKKTSPLGMESFIKMFNKACLS